MCSAHQGKFKSSRQVSSPPSQLIERASHHHTPMSSINTQRWLVFQDDLQPNQGLDERTTAQAGPMRWVAERRRSAPESFLANLGQAAPPHPSLQPRERTVASSAGGGVVERRRSSPDVFLDENVNGVQIHTLAPPLSKPGKVTTAASGVMLEKRLMEAREREKKAASEVELLKRKIVTMEERLKTVKKEQKKFEIKNKDDLEFKIALAVSRIVIEQELDAETKTEIAHAVATAVAQTLLAKKGNVAPPKRKPPKKPESSALCTI